MARDHNTTFAGIALFMLIGSFLLSGTFGIAGIVVTCLVVYVLLCATNAIDAGEKKARSRARARRNQ